MRIPVITTIICILLTAGYSQFVYNFELQYAKDEVWRPTDTLFYIPYIKNIVDCDSSDPLVIEKEKKRLFKRLSLQKINMTYTYAFDINSGFIYFNPRGDMDFIERRSPYKLHFFQIDESICHPKFIAEMKSLIQYARELHPDYIFQICNIDGIDFSLYWVIINDHFYVIQYNYSDNTIVQYNASEYINNIAPDYVFSSSLRLSILNGQHSPSNQ